jgi:hypothetical protein
MPVQSFTAAYDTLVRVLRTHVGVCAAFDPNAVDPLNPPVLNQFSAVWDTGASGSVISQKVVDACALRQTGIQQVHGVGGSELSPTFLVNILLPNQVGFVNLKVTLGKLRGFDLLIGMDIIGSGDFAVTNKDGKTVFSYRHPSMERIDFVSQAEHPRPATVPREQDRNARCACGSGKKYKNCHGAIRQAP